MRILALAQQKGGVGKSTLAVNIAVDLVRRGYAVAIIDMDTQASVGKWAKRREADQPVVMIGDLHNLARDLASLRKDGVAYTLLDLPGRASSIVAEGMKAAHFVIIPAGPFDIDIEASIDTIQAARRLRRRFAFVLNGAPNAARTKEFAEGLIARDQPVAPVFIGRRLDYPDAIAEGLGVSEFAPKGKASLEIAALTDFLLERLSNEQSSIEEKKLS